MQYNLFCQSNKVARSVLSLVFILLGLMYSPHWWAFLLIGYGCYLTTSTYSSSDRTAHKLAAQLKASGAPFPCSRYIFDKKAMRVISQPDGDELSPLPYDKVAGLGEDLGAFYLFRDRYGGYRIPKSAIEGREKEFRQMVEARTGRRFIRRRSPLSRLRDWMTARENEPLHL